MKTTPHCASARLLPVALFAAATMLPFTATAATWTGTAGDGDFSTAGNWDGSAVPSGEIASISNGDTVSIDSNVGPSAIYLSGGSVLNQTAGTVTLSAQTRIGNGPVDSVLSTWNISGGTVNGTQLRVGQSESSDAGKGIVDISGSAVLNFSQNVQLANGKNGYGELNLSGNARLTASDFSIGRWSNGGSSEGKLTVSENAYLSSAGQMVIGENGASGSVSITGGTIEVQKFANHGGMSAFTADGGTLKAHSTSTSTNFLQNVTLDLGSNGVIIDTNGANVGDAVNGSYSSLIQGVGPMTKTGSGTLTLAHAHTYTGATVVSEGELKLGDNQDKNSYGKLASASISVASGATLTMNHADAISTTAVLYLASGSTLFLDFASADVITINALFVDGVAVAANDYSVDDDSFWSNLGVNVHGTAGSSITVVPEPSTYALFGAAGLAGLLVLRRRRNA